MYVEVGAKQSKKVTELLQQFGYTLFDSDAGSENRFPVSECTFNTLAVPSETLDSMLGTSVRKVA
jgi:hypothetical protein